ncbi:hypothetical protein BD560DRAFT_428750 [Blakeslea trispora]|nr:hypothetical protein BD560DRAFT_428750 [Blakeslea trispora]
MMIKSSISKIRKFSAIFYVFIIQSGISANGIFLKDKNKHRPMKHRGLINTKLCNFRKVRYLDKSIAFDSMTGQSLSANDLFLGMALQAWQYNDKLCTFGSLRLS